MLDVMIRCPNCFGNKIVAGLGGMDRDCNLCNGQGKIKECDRPVPKVAPVPIANDFTDQVRACVDDIETIDSDTIDSDRLLETRKKIFKRKQN